MKTMKYVSMLLAIVLIAEGCDGGKKTENAVQKVAVEVTPIGRGDITVTKTYSGTLEGARESKIYVSIPERIVELPVSEGQYVKKGQPIIMLDKLGVTSQYNQAFAYYQNSKDNYEKMKRLYEQQAISEMDFRGARTAFEVSEANFNAAKEAVELSSPIDGIVTDISVNLGQQAPLGVAIATVASTLKMRLTIFVGSTEISKLSVGKQAKVAVDSNEPITATITEHASSADPETRLFRVELEMANPDGILKPGMYARAHIVTDDLKQVLVVDNNALFAEEGITKAYIVENDSAFARSIEIGPSDGQKTQVLSGLTQGQLVITAGKSTLRDRTPVSIKGQGK